MGTQENRYFLRGYVIMSKGLLEENWYIALQPAYAKVAVKILAGANFKETIHYIGTEPITVARGQMFTHLSELAKLTGGVSIQNVRSALKVLEKVGFIVCKSLERKYLLITVINYAELQKQENYGKVTNTAFTVGDTSKTNTRVTQQILKTNTAKCDSHLPSGEVTNDIKTPQHSEPHKSAQKENEKSLKNEISNPKGLDTASQDNDLTTVTVLDGEADHSPAINNNALKKSSKEVAIEGARATDAVEETETDIMNRMAQEEPEGQVR